MPKLESKTLEQAASKDWRASSKVAPILNQGTCGSCWAFSGTDVLQSALAIYYGYSISTGSASKTLSIQYFVDCDVYNDGCLGGLQLHLFLFAKNSGFFYTSGYKYTTYLGKEMPC